MAASRVGGVVSRIRQRRLEVRGGVVEEMAGEYEGKAKIGKVNVDVNPEVSIKYGIRSIPALLIFKNGEVVDQIVGAVPKTHLTKQLDAQV